MQLTFHFDQTRCIGCYTCVVACKDWHDMVVKYGKERNAVGFKYNERVGPSVVFIPKPDARKLDLLA